jgi:hypothetical protein
VYKRQAHAQLVLHAVALCLMLAALAGWESAARPAGVLFAAASCLQGVLLLRVYARYRQFRVGLSVAG